MQRLLGRPSLLLRLAGHRVPPTALRGASVLLSRAFAAQRSGKDALAVAELRLISELGKALGVMPPKEAMAIAQQRDLALVEVQGSATPPVWRLKEKLVEPETPAELPPPPEQKRRDTKTAKPPKEKEVRLTDSIAPRDAEHKVATALKFLAKGHVVKVLVLNQGKKDPKVAGKALAVTMVEQVCSACEEVAKASDIMGATSLRASGETSLTRNIIGPVFATLTPKEGAYRQGPTPRSTNAKAKG